MPSWGWVFMIGLVPLWERDPIEFVLSLPQPCEGTRRRRLSASQEEGFHQNPATLAPDFQLQVTELINFYCWSHPVYAISLWQLELTKTLGKRKKKENSLEECLSISLKEWLFTRKKKVMAWNHLMQSISFTLSDLV